MIDEIEILKLISEKHKVKRKGKTSSSWDTKISFQKMLHNNLPGTRPESKVWSTDNASLEALELHITRRIIYTSNNGKKFIRAHVRSDKLNDVNLQQGVYVARSPRLNLHFIGLTAAVSYMEVEEVLIPVSDLSEIVTLSGNGKVKMVVSFRKFRTRIIFPMSKVSLQVGNGVLPTFVSATFSQVYF